MVKMTKALEESLDVINNTFQPNDKFSWMDCIGKIRKPQNSLDRLFEAGKLKRKLYYINIKGWRYWYED